MKLKPILLLLMLISGTQVLAANAQKITFATEGTYPPFESVGPSGKLQGFDIDMANAICAKLKAQCVFINQPFDSLIPSLKIGKFDAIIAAMAITPERQKVIDFSVPYYSDSVSFVALNSVNFDVTPGKLKDKIIGVQQGTTFQNYLQHIYGKDVTVKTYASQQNAFMDLSAGRVDAVMGDTPLVALWLKDQEKNKFHVLGKPINNPLYFGVGNGIAVKKGNTALLNQLNGAISSLKKDGTAAKLEQKYFG
jgi:arginine transport system substrate-binding protein